MQELFVYGAGMRGRKTARTLIEHGIVVAGFFDSFKTGTVDVETGGGAETRPIVPLGAVEGKSGVAAIVAIVNPEARKDAEAKLAAAGIKVIDIKDLLFSGRDRVEQERLYIAEHHVSNMDGYFARAESAESLATFWAEDSLFRRRFDTLNLESVIELACGRGRHVPQYIGRAGRVTLVDILRKNIDLCKERFAGNGKISYLVNDGKSLAGLPSDSYTAVFSYDAMVHFELLDIFSYLKEMNRVLRRGGRALIHHSNNTKSHKLLFETAEHGRNYMSKDLFAYLAFRAGLEVVEQDVFDWGDSPSLDCLSLVEKP